jgi:hypothetical protein
VTGKSRHRPDIPRQMRLDCSRVYFARVKGTFGRGMDQSVRSGYENVIDAPSPQARPSVSTGGGRRDHRVVDGPLSRTANGIAAP